MSRVAVRSGALSRASRAVGDAAGELRRAGAELLVASARCRPPSSTGASAVALLAGWLRLEGAVARAAGPRGVAGEALALESLAVRLAVAARAYEGVEAGVAAVMASVAGAADLSATVGWLAEEHSAAQVRVVDARWSRPRVEEVADLVAAGQGLDGGRVRVLELASADGGSAWVVVIPGTQRWSPVAGSNPFDLTTDVRAVAGGDDATVAVSGVALALERARAASGRSRADDPVLLVGHSQGGILAAALASDAGFARRHHVTHLLTTGAPIGLLPVPASVRVLAVEHADDPVPGLDLTPNPATASWFTLRTGAGPPADVAAHRLERYVESVRVAVAAAAPTGPAHGGGVAGVTGVPGVAGWCAGAAAFVGRPVRNATDVVVTRRGVRDPVPHIP